MSDEYRAHHSLPITHHSSLVSQRRSFLLRIDPAVLEAVQRWANDDLRSLNGQIEFILRRALADSGRARPNESGEAQRRAQDAAPLSPEQNDQAAG
jgi:hypothetical protein